MFLQFRIPVQKIFRHWWASFHCVSLRVLLGVDKVMNFGQFLTSPINFCFVLAVLEISIVGDFRILKIESAYD